VQAFAFLNFDHCCKRSENQALPTGGISPEKLTLFSIKLRSDLIKIGVITKRNTNAGLANYR
jgi:hypothetical protein